MLFKISVLKHSTSFIGKRLCWSLILIKLETPPVAASLFLIEYQIAWCYKKIALLLK